MKNLIATLSIIILFFTTNIFSQNAGDYRSATDGGWSVIATWETYNGTTWVAAASAPTGTETISITHAVNVDVAVNITGYVKVDGAGNLTAGAALSLNGGGTYEHAVNGGDIPSATWNAGSTCLITGVATTSPGGANQDFYNFTWNCAGQSSNLDVSWSGNTIGGDVTVENTGGTNQLRLTSSSDYTDSITINGDVVLTGGVLTATGSSTAMEYTIVVNGSINVTGGSFALSRGSGGNVTWFVGDDLSVANAEVRSSNSDAKFLFYNDVTHNLTYNTVSYNGTINYEVDADDTLDVTDGPDAVDLPVNGTLKNAGQVNTLGVVSFEDGSTYHHARNGGSIPVATWESGSTLYVDAITNQMPGNRNQSFHHIVWDCPDQAGNYNMGFDEVTIGGNITLNNTGLGRWYLCGPTALDTATVDVMGNLTLVQGQFAAHGTGNAGTVVTVHIYGNVNALAGNFSVSRGSQGGTGTTDFYLHGENFILSDLTTQNSNAAGAKFIFAGTNPQTLVFTNVTFGGGGCPVEVASGSDLNVGTSEFGGSGIFTLNDGATLRTANVAGLDSTFKNTGTITLSENANYTFNGTAGQVTGTLLPAVVNDLTVDNTEGVTLNHDNDVAGDLTLNGDLNLNGFNIYLGETGTLIETPGNTVKGETGSISAQGDLVSGVANNIGGLGMVITSTTNEVDATVTRTHAAASGNGNEGIFRQYYFEFLPTDKQQLVDASVLFYYDESELNGIQEANLVAFHSTNSGTNWVGIGGTVNTTDNFVDVSNITNLDMDYTIADLNNPIPVELSSFSALTDGRFVTLNWSTASELNNQGWDVERRTTIKENVYSEWTKAGFVKGSGSTTETTSYSFSDKKVTTGVLQYRLKQIDFDGTFTYSEIAEVELNGPTEFALFQNYPNPFNPSTVIRFEIPEASFINLTIYNAVGEEVATLVNRQMESGVYLWNFDAGSYPSGLYIYRLTAGSKVFTKKMMLIK